MDWLNVTFIIICILGILGSVCMCKAEKKEMHWHHTQLIGCKEDKIKALEEKISALESQPAVKDALLNKQEELQKLNTERLWDMNTQLLNKATEKKCKLKEDH